jgi:hypothetical protein
MDRAERGGVALHTVQFGQERAANRAPGDVRAYCFVRGGLELAVEVLIQGKIGWVHDQPASIARSFMRALKTCDFEVPSAIPSSRATSL